MAPNYTKPPFSFFAPPGVVSVSPAALKMARDFDEDIRRLRPDDDWIISFDWSDSRIIRRPVGGPREELGPGLDLVAYDRADIPSEVIQRMDGVAFAIKIPGQIYKASTRRLIDVEGLKLILR